MRSNRIFTAQALNANHTYPLETEATHHVVNVLRLQVGDKLTLFNDSGNEFVSTILEIHKNKCLIHVDSMMARHAESPLHIHLYQAIARGKKMDFVLQKATELGVACITPVLSAHGNVQLDGERQDSRMHHWRKILVSACEQSGRNRIPTLHPPLALNQAIRGAKESLKIVFSPAGTHRLQQLSLQKATIAIAIGPEGGFSGAEYELFTHHDWKSCNLGPRVLRTETVALCACAILQASAGDL